MRADRILLIVAIGTIQLGCRRDGEESRLPLKVFEAVGWEPDGVLLCRMEASGGSVFLLSQISRQEHETLCGEGKDVGTKTPWTSPVYRYDPDEGALTQVSPGQWERSTGAVFDRRTLRYFMDPTLMVNRNRLRCRGRTISTRGKYALACGGLKGHGLVAVLSADSPASDSPMPFVGRLRPRGQHYHEVLEFPGLKVHGEPVPLPLKSDQYSLDLCWSPDGRFVIYYETSFRELCVVPVETVGE